VRALPARAGEGGVAEAAQVSGAPSLAAGQKRLPSRRRARPSLASAGGVNPTTAAINTCALTRVPSLLSVRRACELRGTRRRRGGLKRWAGRFHLGIGPF
jgi:hypothetical protein